MLDVVPVVVGVRGRLDSADAFPSGWRLHPYTGPHARGSTKEFPQAVNIATLLPFILILGVMLVMTRSAKNKQRQLQSMRDQMQPGSGVRTIGGMIALVKEVRDTTVLLEVAPGVHSIYVKNAIAAVLPEEEYDRLVHNDVPLTFDDALTEEPADEKAEAAADENAVNAADDVQDTAENTAETPETAETAKNRADGDK